MNKPQWQLSTIWNKSIESREERIISSRDHLWASELGRQDADLYLKLMGETPTNPPNNRSLRKFEAGNIWEWIVKLILMRAGLYQSTQNRVEYRKEGQLAVTGKLDFIVGGKPNYDEAIKNIDDLKLPEIFTRASEGAIEYFKTNYQNGLEEKIIEVKSISSFAFEKVEFTGKALAGHDLQAFHYAKGLAKPATIVYISRDDARMIEVPIMPDDQAISARYEAKIARISEYYNTKTMPPIEPAIFFDTDVDRFTKNFNAEYSPFLTKFYGVKDPEEFDEKWSGKVQSWNRVIARIKEKKALTENNKAKITEMTAEGYDIISLLNK